MIVSKDRRWSDPILIFFFALAARTAYWLYRGTALGGDTSGYLRVCSVWASDPVAGLFAHKGILYSGFTLPLCGFLSIPGSTFDLWIGLQILLSATGCVIVYGIGKELVDRQAGFASGIALAALWDTFYWDVYVLSDSLFTFGMILVLGALLWHHQTQNWQSRLAVVLSMSYLVISRPHGFPLVAGWLLYDLLPPTDNRRLNLFRSRLVPAVIGVGTIATLPYAIQRYNLLTIWNRGDIIVNSTKYVYPFISGNTDEPLRFVFANLHHLAVMAILKVAFFFTPLLPRHSLIHIGTNLVTYLPIVSIGMLGLVHAYRENFDLFRMWATPILVLTAITAITFVSWDLRYRAPLGPAFALAFGYAISTSIDSLPDSLSQAVPKIR